MPTPCSEPWQDVAAPVSFLCVCAPPGARQRSGALYAAACGHQNPSAPLQDWEPMLCVAPGAHHLPAWAALIPHSTEPPLLAAPEVGTALRDGGSVCCPGVAGWGARRGTVQQRGPVGVPAGGSLGSAALPAAVLMEEVRNLQLLAPSASLLRVSLEIQQQRGVSMETYTGLSVNFCNPKHNLALRRVLLLPRAARSLERLGMLWGTERLWASGTPNCRAAPWQHSDPLLP